jgi:hypothetical protein
MWAIVLCSWDFVALKLISGVQEIVLFREQTISNYRLLTYSTHVLDMFSCEVSVMNHSVERVSSLTRNLQMKRVISSLIYRYMRLNLAVGSVKPVMTRSSVSR